MPVFSIREAKAKLSILIEKASAGEEVIIADGSKPLARLLPIRAAGRKRRPGSLRGKLILVEPPPWVSLRQDVLKWRDAYDANEDSFNRGLEKQLRGKFQERKCATCDDLRDLLKWKFAEMPGRLIRELKLLSTVSPDIATDATQQAFALTEDSDRLRQLRRIKGVGVAVASVILSFYDPEDYGIIDIHSWRELFGKEQKGNKQKSSFNESDFLRFTKELRRLAHVHGLPARDVEKALFHKNRVQPRSFIHQNFQTETPPRRTPATRGGGPC